METKTITERLEEVNKKTERTLKALPSKPAANVLITNVHLISIGIKLNLLIESLQK
jgi:hypothetical protein|tara:strand:+ start:415 stop:582 length:168 start_codon:yes stop_codon:yes gene_type:complete